jgi:DNA (cytosine-5)-methyltransferase 1
MNGGKSVREYTAFDLFCGAGGFSEGFMNAGIHVLGGLDYDWHALATYWANLCGPGSKWIGGIPRKAIPDPGSAYIKSRNDLNPAKIVICGDIRDYHGWQILEACGVDHIDVILGSPPCTSFSSMSSKRKREAPEDYLCFEMARIILEIQPDVFCMENVPYFTKKKLSDGRRIMDIFMQITEKCDWGLYYEVAR